MDRNDRSAIEDLFAKLATVERQSPQRDAGAEAFIRERIAAQPGAPYYMAQTIVVQEQALRAAQARIEELEGQAGATAGEARRPGGPFGSLFGESRPNPRAGSVPSGGWAGGAASQQPLPAARRSGGGFLAGAAQTAMGVAGGMLLANVIGGLLGGGGAQAAEANTSAGEPAVDEAGAAEAGFDDGGDLGDMEF